MPCAANKRLLASALSDNLSPAQDWHGFCRKENGSHFDTIHYIYNGKAIITKYGNSNLKYKITKYKIK